MENILNFFQIPHKKENNNISNRKGGAFAINIKATEESRKNSEERIGFKIRSVQAAQLYEVNHAVAGENKDNKGNQHKYVY